METRFFKPSVQYGDNTGAVKIDDSGQTHARRWLKDNHHMTDEEFLVGIEMFAGESHGVHKDPVNVTFLIVQQPDYDNVRAMIDRAIGPIPVRRVTTSMNLIDFFGFFKRFSLVFSPRAMLEGKEYTFLDY